MKFLFSKFLFLCSFTYISIRVSHYIDATAFGCLLRNVRMSIVMIVVLSLEQLEVYIYYMFGVMVQPLLVVTSGILILFSNRIFYFLYHSQLFNINNPCCNIFFAILVTAIELVRIINRVQ